MDTNKGHNEANEWAGKWNFAGSDSDPADQIDENEPTGRVAGRKLKLR